jgi:hypothetical protein
VGKSPLSSLAHKPLLPPASGCKDPLPCYCPLQVSAWKSLINFTLCNLGFANFFLQFIEPSALVAGSSTLYVPKHWAKQNRQLAGSRCLLRLRRDSFSPLPVSGGCRHSWVCDHIPLVSASCHRASPPLLRVSSPSVYLFMRMHVITFTARPDNPRWSSLPQDL